MAYAANPRRRISNGPASRRSTRSWAASMPGRAKSIRRCRVIKKNNPQGEVLRTLGNHPHERGNLFCLYRGATHSVILAALLLIAYNCVTGRVFDGPSWLI